MFQVPKPEELHTPEDASTGVTTAPQRSTSVFVGREDELRTLKVASQNKDTPHLINVAVTGLPGIGKTELVLQYIKNSRESNYKNIIWVPSDSTDTINNVFISLSQALGIVDKDYRVCNSTMLIVLVQKLYKSLNTLNTLVVFDNVLVDIECYMPPIGVDTSNITIIVTSRYTKWQCDTQVSLQCLPVEVATQFLIKSLPSLTESDKKHLPSLCAIFGSVPLALKLVVAYFQHTVKIENLEHNCESFNIETLVTNLQCSPVNFFTFKPKLFNKVEYNMLELYRSISNVISRTLNGFLAIKLLEYMSFLCTENISARMFHKLSEIDNKSDISEALVLLSEYSLISITDHRISISPMIQFIFRTNLSSVNREKTLLTVLSCFEQENNYPNQYYIPYMSYICDRAHMMNIFDNYRNRVVLQKYPLLFLLAAEVHEIPQSPSVAKKNVDKVINVYEAVSSCVNDKDFKLRHLLMRILKGSEEYKVLVHQSDVILYRVSMEELESNFHGLKLLYYRSYALFKLNKTDKAFELLSRVHQLFVTKHGYVEDTYNALELLCEIACAADTDCNSEYFQHCVSMVQHMSEDFKWLDQDSTNIELTPLNILRKHYIKHNQASKALELVTDVQIKVERSVKSFRERPEYNNKGDESKRIVSYVTYQKCVCLDVVNDIQGAWDLLRETLDDEDLCLKIDKKMILFCKLTAKLDKELQAEGLDLIERYMRDWIDSELDMESVKVETFTESFHLFEQIATEKQVFELYEYLVEVLKKDNNEIALAHLQHARYFYTKENERKAWQWYSKACKLINHEVGTKPCKSEEMVTLFTNLEKEVKVAIHEELVRLAS